MDLFEWAETHYAKSTSAQADLVTDAAIATAGRGADPRWVHWADRAIRHAAARAARFTTDDVWDLLETWEVDPPREPRALGAVLRRLAREGVITSTGTYIKSSRVECHKRPVVVWRLSDEFANRDHQR